jgi:hypothetical protein
LEKNLDNFSKIRTSAEAVRTQTSRANRFAILIFEEGTRNGVRQKLSVQFFPPVAGRYV